MPSTGLYSPYRSLLVIPERGHMKQKLLLAVATIFGLFITYVDSSPNWDDTAVIVFVLLIGSGIIGLLIENKPWLYALAIGLWLPLRYIVTAHNLSMLVLLALPFLGVYAGWAVHLGYRKLRQVG